MIIMQRSKDSDRIISYSFRRLEIIHTGRIASYCGENHVTDYNDLRELGDYRHTVVTEDF